MNIRWVQGLAEDLPAVAPGPFRLVTSGQSFHWTDEQHVAETVYDMLLRDSESVLSGYLSLSSAAPHLFGDRLDDFTDQIRALLANRSAEGIFWDWPGDTEIILARKPGRRVDQDTRI